MRRKREPDMKAVTERNASIKLKDGFDTLELHPSERMDLKLDADKGTNAELLITYDGTQADLHIDVHADQDCELRLLLWNQMSGKLTLHLNINALDNSRIDVGIADLQDSAADYHIKSMLCFEGAEVAITSICLANQKHWLMNMEHCHSHTYSDMKNFAVTEEGGDYRMEACGSIQKGAYGCSTHQTSRVLTMSENHKCEVLPILLIDEDEVKASHATTVGQPDAAQLYYLKSRGLNTQQALGLLKLGYLLPITEVLSNQEIQKKLQEQIEEKVMKHD